MKTLKSRITVLLLGVLLITQLISFVVIRSSINTNVSSAVQAEVELGGRVLERLLQQKRETLAQVAQAIAGDFGFRAAVASGDAATIQSALTNHGRRSEVNLLGFFDGKGRIEMLVDGHGQLAPMPDAFRDRARDLAESNQGGLIAVDGELIQYVVSPVRAPIVIGYMLVGFKVDKNFAEDLRLLSGIDLSFFSVKSTTNASGSLLIEPIRPEYALAHSNYQVALARQIANLKDDSFNLEVGGIEYASRIQPLGITNGATIHALLKRSIDDAALPYARLQIILIALTVIGLLFSIVASLTTAHRIAEPIRRLSISARKLGAGEDNEPLDVGGSTEVTELAMSFNAMSKQIRDREARILELAYRDNLTGLHNRTSLLNLLDANIAQQPSKSLCLIIIDLKRFKFVNDVLGLRAGDHLLTLVGHALEAKFDTKALCVARSGGDEFALLFDRQENQDPVSLANAVCDAVEHAFDVGGTSVDVTVVAGFALSPEDGQSPEAMLTKAEVAMYAAKDHASRVSQYQEELDSGSEVSLSMMSELQTAIARKELEVYFQPKIDLASGEAFGAEALIRWNHPQRGFMPPDSFIPFAESSGVVVELTRYVLENTIAQIARWNSASMPMIVSVNLSTRDLMERQLPETVATMLREHDVQAEQIVLEITESAIIDDLNHALETMNALREIGIKLSVDDYGTGFSSLAYLKQLPVDELKIDRSFVNNLATDAGDRTIVRSTVELGHNLGLNVVAEGIENEATATLLTEMGCNSAQGYFFARPMNAKAFAAWIRSWRERPAADQQTAPTLRPTNSQQV